MNPFATFAGGEHQRVMKQKTIYVFCLLMFLLGCDGNQSPEAFFNQLLNRIANVTEVTFHPIDHLEVLPSYPRPRDLVLSVEDIRVGFSSYIGLGRCGLVGDISARNSSIGKFQPASARLLYERRFLFKLKGCIKKQQELEKKEQKNFLAEVQAIADRKTATLPAVIWNATFASPEFRVLLGTRTEPLPMHSDQSVIDIVSALGFISGQAHELQVDQELIDESTLESRYYVLNSSRLVGQLLQGMIVSIAYMERGSQLLEIVAEQRKLCPSGRKTVNGSYLFNVFQKFYIGEAQPYISLIHTQMRQIVGVIDELVKKQENIPAAFRVFYDNTLDPDSRSSVWFKFNYEITRHTKAWQSVLKQCELMPKA